VETVTLGASSGTTHSFFESFVGGMSDGGEVIASSTASNSTLLASTLMRNPKQIDHTLNTSAGTLTLPASSSLSGWLPNPGDEREMIIRNATTTSLVLTVAAGTGMTFKNASTTGAAAHIPGDTDGKNVMVLRFVRQLNKDFLVFLESYKD
jgi:hypothetical protein